MPSRIRERARVVVVTGATAGVGRAIVRRFAQAGDHVGLIARDVGRPMSAVGKCTTALLMRAREQCGV
ncbi:MAG: SDR family NAD(P)-dependent oxidoreductase [Xanthobacteraceae bacterium]|jgi:NADP-dependent 3-hydroxy acid dehydrogenase YdfG